MDWTAWFTLGVVASCFCALACSRAAPDVIMSGGLTLLLVSGILTPQEALSGLANEGMVTVAVLYIVVRGVRNSVGMEWLFELLLVQRRSESCELARLMTLAAGLSGFLNNTPVVSLLVTASCQCSQIASSASGA